MENRPIKTIRGRVVYDRKIHVLSEADVKRMFGKFVVDHSDDPDNLLQLVRSILISVLEKLFSTVGASRLAEPLFNFINGLLSQLLDFLESSGSDMTVRPFMIALYTQVKDRTERYRVTSV